MHTTSEAAIVVMLAQIRQNIAGIEQIIMAERSMIAGNERQLPPKKQIEHEQVSYTTEEEDDKIENLFKQAISGGTQ